jgi:hypothetical protein
MSEVGGGMSRSQTKHAVVHNAIDIGEEFAVSVELRKDQVNGILRQAEFCSSSEVIILQNTVRLMAEQRTAARVRQRQTDRQRETERETDRVGDRERVKTQRDRRVRHDGGRREFVLFKIFIEGTSA